jgi:hypothetical protein
VFGIKSVRATEGVHPTLGMELTAWWKVKLTVLAGLAMLDVAASVYGLFWAYELNTWQCYLVTDWRIQGYGNAPSRNGQPSPYEFLQLVRGTVVQTMCAVTFQVDSDPAARADAGYRLGGNFSAWACDADPNACMLYDETGSNHARTRSQSAVAGVCITILIFCACSLAHILNLEERMKQATERSTRRQDQAPKRAARRDAGSVHRRWRC